MHRRNTVSLQIETVKVCKRQKHDISVRKCIQCHEFFSRAPLSSSVAAGV
jgi:hypothetical protein